MMRTVDVACLPFICMIAALDIDPQQTHVSLYWFGAAVLGSAALIWRGARDRWSIESRLQILESNVGRIERYLVAIMEHQNVPMPPDSGQKKLPRHKA